MEPKEAIALINDRLKATATPVRVRMNGSRLALRATLPKKRGDGEGRRQYDIFLGIPANRDGLRRIEIEAQKLGGLMALGQFSWSLYLKPQDNPQERTIAQLVEEFKAEYLRSHKIQEATWKETWQRTFDRLPQNEELSEAVVLAVVLLTESHSRSRELACQRLQKLTRFAGLAVDLKAYQGEYNERSTKPREIPADDLIVEWRDKIPNTSWQWVYGMLATFGIRPHEAFFCEFIDQYTLRILEGKTGGRITRAIMPEWAEKWRLIEVDLPKVTGKSHRDFGQRVSHRFGKYAMPFVPYDLRHGFAIRGSIVKRLPVSVMAQMMGHSVGVHTRIYHAWLSDATNEKVYREMILGEED